MSDQTLTHFVESVCNESHLRVESDLGDGFVRLKSEEAERRQAAHDIRSTEDALIELLRNSRDAHARSIFIATGKSEKIRKLLVIDDGEGVPASMSKLIFEPRVTSKLDTVHFDKWGIHGRGMALYALKVNSDSCGIVASSPGMGTALFADLNTNHITEKTDQSTFPSFLFEENHRVSVRGPKNIIRISCEFAFEHRDAVSIYLGSPAEIAATLWFYGKDTLSLLDRTFALNENELPLLKRLATASDEESFCKIAQSLGIELSVRTAYRIMGGKIEPLEPLLDQIQARLFAQMETKQKKAAPARNARGRKKKPTSFSHDDLDHFARQIKNGYKELAQSYYLTSDVDVSVQICKDQLIVKIPLAPDDSA